MTLRDNITDNLLTVFTSENLTGAIWHIQTSGTSC